MIKPPIDLQDLRRRIYVKAKAEPSWRFWGLYVHVCKIETLYEAYAMAKANNGAPGVDGVTFEAIERDGLGAFLERIRVMSTTWVTEGFNTPRMLHVVYVLKMLGLYFAVGLAITAWTPDWFGQNNGRSGAGRRRSRRTGVKPAFSRFPRSGTVWSRVR